MESNETLSVIISESQPSLNTFIPQQETTATTVGSDANSQIPPDPTLFIDAPPIEPSAPSNTLPEEQSQPPAAPNLHRRIFLKDCLCITAAVVAVLERLLPPMNHNQATKPEASTLPTPLLGERVSPTLLKIPRSAFHLPLVGVSLEQITSTRLPNAAREYRHGTHAGFDLYTTFGMPVLAIADGTVIRADREFTEMTTPLHAYCLRICKQLRTTPPEILDRLRGRCLYVDHGVIAGSRLVAIYAHLNSVVVEAGQPVKRGQLIATVGNSGTNAGVRGSREDAHLHLELRLQRSGQPETFFGAGMTEAEIRQALKEVFANAAA